MKAKTRLKIEMQLNVKVFLIKNRAYRRFCRNLEKYKEKHTDTANLLPWLAKEKDVPSVIRDSFDWFGTLEGAQYWYLLYEKSKAQRNGKNKV
jgi:hypothetical protein